MSVLQIFWNCKKHFHIKTYSYKPSTSIYQGHLISVTTPTNSVCDFLEDENDVILV